MLFEIIIRALILSIIVFEDLGLSESIFRLVEIFFKQAGLIIEIVLLINRLRLKIPFMPSFAHKFSQLRPHILKL